MTTLYDLRKQAVLGLDQWLDAAVEAVKKLALSRPKITSDDVWALLQEQKPGASHAFDGRTMGAAFAIAAQRGYVYATDRTVPSRRPVCHRRPIRVWVSAFHRKPSSTSAKPKRKTS